MCSFSLASLEKGRRYDTRHAIATWICIISSIAVNLLFTGAPLANVVGERFGNYLSKDLVENYCNSVLAELVDDKSSIERRRMRLGLLYERQGQVIANALKRGPNFQNICTLLLIWCGWSWVSCGWFRCRRWLDKY